MWIWLINPKSTIRNITAIRIWRVRQNTKIRVGAITLLHLLCSCKLNLLPSPETPSHQGLQLIPKTQLLLFSISLRLEELVFGEILSSNHSIG